MGLVPPTKSPQNAIDKDWFKDLVRFGVATMMRAGEILTHRWNPVDLERDIVCVENTREFKTKTHKARLVPLDEWVYYMLKNKERTNVRVSTFPDEGSLSVRYVSRRSKKYVRKAGVRRDIHFRCLFYDIHRIILFNFLYSSTEN